MPIASLLLAGCAWLGHAYFLTIITNCLYGHPIPHRYLRKGRKLLAGFVFLLPWAWVVYPARSVEAVLIDFHERGAYAFLAPYLLLCLVMSLLVLPTVTLLRAVQRQPRAVLRETSRTLDFAQIAQQDLSGSGKHAWLCSLPGNRPFCVEFTEATWQIPGLAPAHHGLTILHLSDLHLSGTPDRLMYQHLMEQCMAHGVPDLIAITGDLVDSPEHHRWLIPVLGRLRSRYGIYAILGNHDTWWDTQRIIRRLNRVGISYLGNRWEVVEVHGQPLVLIGHEGPWIRPAPDLSECPARPGTLRVLLSHTPDNIGWAVNNGVAVMLSGHNHGGQIRLPIIGSMFVPSRYSRRFDAGTFQVGPTLLHVNRGIAGREPLRYFCDPQVTWVTLVRARTPDQRRITISRPTASAGTLSVRLG
jgi:predicted MPP superfamily phosphohydrolase